MADDDNVIPIEEGRKSQKGGAGKPKTSKPKADKPQENKAEAKSKARRSPFDQERFEEVLDRMADGRSLRDVCSDDDMPSKAAFMAWVRENPHLADHYARAREAAIDAIVDDMIALSDTANAANANAVRVMVETRKWAAAKMSPKKYGDLQRVDLNVSHADMPLSELKQRLIANSEALGLPPPDFELLRIK